MKQTLIFSVAWIAAVSALVGCSGNHAIRMMNEARPALADYTTVVVVTENPVGARPIAEIRSSFSLTVDGPKGATIAVEELRRHAASVGANVVVMNDQRNILTQERIPVGIAAYRSSVSQVVILEATAVWMDDATKLAAP